MKTTRTLCAALLCLSFIAGCALPAAPKVESEANSQPSGANAAGFAIAQRDCAACHAVTASDRSKNPEAPALRDLSKSYPVSALEESLAEGIMVGHPDMPEFQFGPADIEALLSYLESIQSQ